MGAIEDKIAKAWEKMAEAALKHSERWNVGQKIAASLVCLLAGMALIGGYESLKVAAGSGVALFGVAFLTFRRRTIETETLVLRDANGKARIVVSAEQGMVFFDEEMRPRLMADVRNSQPVIILQDDKERVVISVIEAKASISLGKSDNSSPGTLIRPEAIKLESPNHSEAWMTATNQGANVVLGTAAETRDLCLHAGSEVSSVTIGRDSKAHLQLAAVRAGKAGLLLFDEQKQLVAKYPPDETASPPQE